MVLPTFFWAKTRNLDVLFSEFASGGFIGHEAK